MRKQTALWTCKDGTRLRICDMEDSHLLNTIRLCMRVARHRLSLEINAGYSVLSTLQGEMATLFCEQDLDRLEDMTPDEYLCQTFPLYEKLLAELERRKLDHPG